MKKVYVVVKPCKTSSTMRHRTNFLNGLKNKIVRMCLHEHIGIVSPSINVFSGFSVECFIILRTYKELITMARKLKRINKDKKQ